MERVLLIEPDDDVRNLIAALLSRGGHEILAVAAGREAIDAMADESFACLVVGSPVTVESDGRRLMFLEYIARRCPELCRSLVVVTTWVDSSRVIDAARRLDACAVFAKPFGASELIAAVGECVAGRRPAKRWYGIPDPADATLGAESHQG